MVSPRAVLKTGFCIYRHEIALLALAAIVFGSGALMGGLRGNDEVRYTQIVHELFEQTQSWRDVFLLQYHDEAYTQKPPLYFWLSALAHFFLPSSTLIASRIPSLLSGLGTLLVVTMFGRSLFGKRTGLLAAALLFTIPQFFIYACSARLDALLVFFVTLAFFGFWRIDRNLGTRNKNLLIFHGAVGLAMLTKGPVGLLLPWLSILGYLTLEGRLASCRRLIFVWSLALSLLPILLWAGLAVALAPHSQGFFQDAIVDNLYGRFVQGTSHAKPFFYYLPAFLKSFLPWTLLWPILGIIAYREIFTANAAKTDRRSAWNFLLSWVLVSFAFFSLCSGKRASYLLPLFPAMSLLCADALLAWLATLPPQKQFVKQFGFILSAVGGSAGTLLGLKPELFSTQVAAQSSLQSFGFGLLALSIALFVLQRLLREPQRLPARSITLCIVFFAALELLIAIFLLPHYKIKTRQEVEAKRLQQAERNAKDSSAHEAPYIEGAAS